MDNKTVIVENFFNVGCNGDRTLKEEDLGWSDYMKCAGYMTILIGTGKPSTTRPTCMDMDLILIQRVKFLPHSRTRQKSGTT